MFLLHYDVTWCVVRGILDEDDSISIEKTWISLEVSYIIKIHVHKCMVSLTLIFTRPVGTLQPTRLLGRVGSKFNWQSEDRARLFSKSSFARLQEIWNSSICLYEIMKKNLSKSTCLTGSFTCPGLSGSGKRRALPRSVKPFKMGFCFYPTLKKQMQPLNPLKSVLKVGDMSSTIAVTAHCLNALSQVRLIGHCVIGQERYLLWPNWLNWWVWPWVPAFEIHIFLIP